MQEYNELVTTDACNTYLEKADKNIQSVASTFSGTAFPTTNLAVGMQCMRTDDSNNIYKLTSTSPVTWELVPSKSYVDNAVTTGVKSVTNFKGATSTAAGAAGLVPAPDKGTQTDYYLSADGTWKKVQQRSVKEVIDIVHPVGSIWETTTTDDPNILWAGTTWVKMDAGRVLVSAGTAATGTVYTAGATGGEEKHQLTVEEMASHNHSASGTAQSAGAHTHTYGGSNNTTTDPMDGLDLESDRKLTIVNRCTTSEDGAHTHDLTITINNTGSNQAHNIMQPYEVIYRWRRTA